MEDPKSKTKLGIALAAYLALAIIATFTLDGVLRTAMWLLFAGLAVKTIAAANDDSTMH